MSSVLVTGGAGFIGSHLVDRLLEEGLHPIVVDNLSSGDMKNLNPGALFYQQSVQDSEMMERVFQLHKPEYVFHLAAQSSVAVSTKDPIMDCETNIKGMLVLLEKSIKYGVKKFIFSSTGGAMYGDEIEIIPTPENLDPHPVSPYGISKYCAEMYLQFYHRENNINYIILRYGNVYGPRQDPNGEAGVVAIFSKRMLNGEDVNIFGDGNCVRDYVYVKDVVEANIKALQCDAVGTYNIGTGHGTNVNDLFAALSRITNYQKEPIYTAPRKGDVRKSILDCSKANQELGWKPKVSLQEGLVMTVVYFKGL
ncbi:MAG: UDP-glucose 4-epimerase [Thermotogae bacterium]|nr:MAG: UDP-glucose 4-epimerase [Thermotogota bacterium]